MKKVILNQISKAVAGGSNYFYLPLHLVKDGKDSHYETTVDLSKLFEVDSNNVPVVKEICVYDEDDTGNMYLSYGGSNADVRTYYDNNPKGTHALIVDGKDVTFDDIAVVVEQSTDVTDDDSSPKDGKNN